MRSTIVRYLLAILLLSLAASAQYTTVTGTVNDPNGTPYASGTFSATLVDLSGNPAFPTMGGNPVNPTTITGRLTSAGAFNSPSFTSNAFTTPTTQWKFNVCSNQGSSSVCFSYTLTVSGASQDVGSTLSSHSAALSVTGGIASSLSGTGKTVTSSTPVINVTQTWNAGGVTFTGIKENITSTASASGSLLADLQVGGTSKWKVDKSGNVTAAGSVTAAGVISSAAITPSTAGGTTAGSAALPFSSAFIGGAATNNFQITGTATGARTVTLPDVSTVVIPVMNHSATAVNASTLHIVRDTCTLGTNCAVTFTGAAVFADTNYVCNAQDVTAAAATNFVATSASVATFTGTGTDVLVYTCIGN